MSQKTILIIEDEASYRKILDERLSKEDFKVISAKNGDEGLISALRDKPDLILLDLIMPKITGIELLRELRRYDDWGKTVPVFIISVLSSSNEQINKYIIELEPTYYFEKTTIKIEDLIEKIKEKLQDSQS